MNKNVLKIVYASLIICVYLILIGFNNKSYAISIDESKYPGYKDKIESLQKSYPNWNIKLLYTGLDWNSVLDGENTGHGNGPTSLTYYTYDGEWICPICGDKRYDVSKNWYCASREAIAYMMDPRNSLTADYIFQFQNLSSSAGTRAEIEKMVQGTFLSKPSCITAFMEAAKEYNISPFHLVSRVVLEQGSSGIGSMNGYIYTTEDGKKVPVFNLFNIKVSGDDKEAGLLAGAKFAYEQGWFTQEDSIKGGAKFLREDYLDKGQTTLYFQKYNVVNKNNLYKHQYMQNIRAANDEGNNIYKSYKNNGILNSHFEFIIPVYENMPKTLAPRPLTGKDTYKGDIASEITQLSFNVNENGEHYIKGEINITEWLNGITWSIPKVTPIMRLKNSNGEYVDKFWVKNLGSNKYYFDIYVENLDPNNKYTIEIESGSSQNISSYRKANVTYNKNVQLGKVKRSILCVENSKLVFKPTNYNGDIATSVNSISISKDQNGKTYMRGEVLISEWIGTIWNIPDVLPKIKLKAKDGTKIFECSVNLKSGNTYNFSVNIDGIDTEKKYLIEVELQNKYNQSKYKKTNLNIQKELKLGTYGTLYIYMKNDVIIFEEQPYSGDIASEITTLSLQKNNQGKTYIKGEINITEWLNGKTWSIPRKLPKMRIEDSNGKVFTELWVLKLEGNNYYFDGYIEGIDTNKSYYIIVESGSVANTSKYKKANAYYGKNVTLGMYKNYSVQMKNSIISFRTQSYIGDIASEITTLSLQKNNQGKTYIKGEINITEWIDGKTWSIPISLPKMRIEDSNGKIFTELWVLKLEGNKYYFDGYIEGIDTSKSYYIKVESGSSLNTSKYKKANAYYGKNVTLGMYKTYSVKIKNSIISFGTQSYAGDIASEITTLSLQKNNKGKTYIKGEINITEWIDGKTWSIPTSLPKMRIEDSNGKIFTELWVLKLEGNKYYFDGYIEGIDTSKSYYIKVESGSSLNTSKYKKANAYYGKNVALGVYNSKHVEITNSTIRFY